MSEAIIAAVIAGAVSLIGTIITVLASSAKTAAEQKTAQAVMETKMEALTGEVRSYKDMVARIPVLEYQMQDASHRIHELEQQRGA